MTHIIKGHLSDKGPGAITCCPASRAPLGRRTAMIRTPIFAIACSRARMFLEAIEQAFDYDPLEGQQCWIGALEKRILRLEAASTLPTDQPCNALSDT